MRKSVFAYIAILWAASIVVTALIASGVGNAGVAPPTPSAPARVERSVGVQQEGLANAAELERENAGLRAEVAALRKERDSIANDHLRLALGQTIRQIMEEQPREQKPGTTWRKRYDLMQEKSKRGMFGGLDEGMTLIAQMARSGPEGIRTLTGVITDHSRSTEERETALEFLSHIADKASLAAIMTLNEPDIMELDYPYDLIGEQISALTTADIREFIPEINRHIAQELGTDTIAPERAEVLAILALAHGNSESLAMLDDPRLLQEDLSGALQIASDLHTRRAREFVEWVYSRHPKDTVRQTASQFLEEW